MSADQRRILSTIATTPLNPPIQPEADPTGPGIAAVEASLDAAPATRRGPSTALWNYPATYTLMAISILVYLAMFRSGPLPELFQAHQLQSVLTAPFELSTLIHFGATSSQLVQQGQVWRLVTGAFVHVTLLHILLNMWCLWNLGLFGEPLLGKRGLIAVYLVTGTAGMLLSSTLSALTGPGVVAGASGSVFGIAGILIVLLSNRKLSVPWDDLRKLRRQVIFFAAANLVLGFAPSALALGASAQLSSLHIDPANLPRIDNSAHLGGFLSGLALGLPLFPKMISGRANYRRRQTITFAFATLLLCLCAYALTKF